MAIYNTPDGRQVVGSVESGNDYHGFNGKRDIIIQLTADGATTDGLNALEYLKAYAVEQNRQNKPIFPNGTRVFISANGYTKAVEADDIAIDGDSITIGGIVWNGSAWDFSNAGQTGGGGSGGGVLVVTDTDGTLDKTWQEIHDAGAAIISISNNAQSKSWYIVTGARAIGENFLVSACLPGVNGKTGEPENSFRGYRAESADGYPVAQ